MTDAVNPLAAQGFDAGAGAYERARATYPPEAVETLARVAGLAPGRSVLELGAGTGKLTRLLVPTGAHVLALEPVAGMRERLLSAAPGVELVDGTAEAIGLGGGSVDAVVVAQAFHWFDPVRALSEIYRVLRPGGALVLAWNFRDEGVPWVAELGRLMHGLAGDAPRARDGRWREDITLTGLFGAWSSAKVLHSQAMTPDDVVDRVASISYVAAAPEAERTALLDEVRALVATNPATAGRATVELPYTTELMWATATTIEPGVSGVVSSVNVNHGGVPKPAVAGTRIGTWGLAGDGHREPEPIHGGPEQAVCLYAQEAIERVRADGHQAFPGAYGENLVLLGIDWSRLAPGDRLVIGDQEDGQGGNGPVVLELTRHATPCQTIAHWFIERRIARISQKANPQDARWYASVVHEGTVAPGMGVRIERAG